MKKGDMRREEVIETAEKLFYTKGYEKTSVQDILDAMHFSKGGFYHHFDSKLSLLQAICEERTKEMCEQAVQIGSASYKSAAARLNAVLGVSALWKNGNANFVSLLIGVAYREDGALMRDKMKNSQLQGMLPIITSILEEGCQKGEFYASDVSAMAEMILRLYMQFTDDIAFLLAGMNDENLLMEAIVRKLWVYRGAIERVLIAPLGSIILFDADELVLLARGILADRRKQNADAASIPVNDSTV